jgi:hypothetical protein
MPDDTQHGNPGGHGAFEQQDLTPRNILYFLLVLAISTIVCIFLLRGVYDFLDKREKASQPAVNPLVTNIPEDTRHVAPRYPQTVFPDPKLEEDERTQLNGIRTAEEQTLYSYGWVNEEQGVVRIPIERAMDLIVQRGLPVRPQSSGSQSEEPNSRAMGEALNGAMTK